MSDKISPGSVDNTLMYFYRQPITDFVEDLCNVKQEITVCNYHLIIFSLCTNYTAYYIRTLVSLAHEQDQQVTNRSLCYITYL